MTFRAALSLVTVADRIDGLDHTLRSLLAQTDTRWQWSLVTGGDHPLYQQVLALVADDPRVLVADGGSLPTAERLLAALSIADAEFVGLLGAGDTLDGGLVAQLRQQPAGSWLYTDEAMTLADGTGQRVWFKPTFCPELLRSQPYVVRSAMLPLSVVREVGGLSTRAGTAQWYDLVLRVTERLGPPDQLTGPYYIRAAEPQSPLPPWIDGEPADRCRVVGEHCDRVGIELTEIAPVVASGRPIGQRLSRRLARTPRVSVVIPTRGSSSTIYGFPRCHVVELIKSLWTSQRYPDLELVIVYDQDTPPEVLEELQEITENEVVLSPFIGKFHYSRKCNQGALAATGEYLCFLNDDMQVVTADWLHELVSLLQDPTVGAAGAKLLFADGTLQHAGVLFNGGTASHLMFAERSDTVALGGIAQLTGERSGVTGACLLMRQDEFRELGGFSELFPLNYNDVDLCLKIRGAGLRILYSPHAVLEHYESQTRTAIVDPVETQRIHRRWRVALHQDPMLNPLLRLPVVPRPDVLDF